MRSKIFLEKLMEIVQLNQGKNTDCLLNMIIEYLTEDSDKQSNHYDFLHRHIQRNFEAIALILANISNKLQEYGDDKENYIPPIVKELNLDAMRTCGNAFDLINSTFQKLKLGFWMNQNANKIDMTEKCQDKEPLYKNGTRYQHLYSLWMRVLEKMPGAKFFTAGSTLIPLYKNKVDECSAN